MIPVRGYDGHKVGVLGLGRTGLSVLRALEAGGAEAVCWDDGQEARDAAEADGFVVADLTKDKPWEGMKALIVSPGIAHLYPEPHPVVVKAQDMGVVIDKPMTGMWWCWSCPPIRPNLRGPSPLTSVCF